MNDVRELPRWTRPFVFLLLTVVAAYQVEGTMISVAPGKLPGWTRLPYAYMAAWDMFSGVGSRHHALVVEAEYGGVREPLDVEALFPTRWESGLRFERPSLYHTPKFRRVAAAICGRAAAAAPARPPEAVVLTDVAWPRRPGRHPGKPGPKAEREELLHYTCGNR